MLLSHPGIFIGLAVSYVLEANAKLRRTKKLAPVAKCECHRHHQTGLPANGHLTFL